MEIERCALDNLLIDLKAFFDLYHRNLTHSSPIFRKHCLVKCGIEFSSYVGVLQQSENPNSNTISAESAFREALDRLEEISRTWLLPLNETTLIGNKLFLTISKRHAFQYVLSQIIAPTKSYGHQADLNLKAFIDYAECPTSSISEYRLQLLSNIGRRVVKCAGYSLTDTAPDADVQLLYTTTTPSGPGYVHCSYVIDSDCKRMQITVEDYLELREHDMRALSKHKYWADGHETTIKTLAEASLIMDLINVKAESIIKLTTDVGAIKREESSGEASFILYNYCRLVGIETKFAGLVASEDYPPLPDFPEIDVSLLNQHEEWVILFDHLLEYPSLLRRIVQHLNEGKIDHHLLCLYLTTISNSISAYYNRCRILQAPKPHLLPTIYARLTFVNAIKKVMNHALDILSIPRVAVM